MCSIINKSIVLRLINPDKLVRCGNKNLHTTKCRKDLHDKQEMVISDRQGNDYPVAKWAENLKECVDNKEDVKYCIKKLFEHMHPSEKNKLVQKLNANLVFPSDDEDDADQIARYSLASIAADIDWNIVIDKSSNVLKKCYNSKSSFDCFMDIFVTAHELQLALTETTEHQ